MADGLPAPLDVGALVSGPRLSMGPDRAVARQTLLSAAQPALGYLRARVAAEDVASLRVLRDGRTQLHALLTPRAAARTCVLALADDPPYRPARESEPGVSQALRASAAMGLAMVDDADRASQELATGARWLRHSWAQLPSADGPASGLLDLFLSGPAPRAAVGHQARIRRLVEGLGAEDRDLALPLLLWLLTLDGALPEPEPVASASVLFDGGNIGVRGTLSVAVLPEGPPALVPDPRTMSGFRADEKFHDSLRNAWTAAGDGTGGTVLWSLTDDEGVTAMAADPSLGCAFAVLLDEVRRQSKGRLRSFVTVRRLNPRTALVGALDGTAEGRLTSVGGYDKKLRAADNGQTVILPEDDLPKAREVWKDDRAARLQGVETVPDAAKAARTVDMHALVRSGASVIGILIALVMIGGAAGYALWDRGEERARRALAADLVTEALTRRATEPRLAGLLALAGKRIDSDTPNAEQAMRDVLETNSGLRIAWKASPGAVDSIAVDDERNRVYTTGDDPYLKAWDLRTGKALGRIPAEVGGLVYSAPAGLLAAEAEDGIHLYSAQGPVPAPLGTLPEPSCAAPGTHRVATAFTEPGSRLIEVRNDGTIAQFDVLTREESDCRRVGPGGAPQARWRILDAAVARAPWASGQLPGEERAVLLLDDNQVVSVGLDTHKVTSEIKDEDIPGQAFAVGANDALVVLATPRGVFAWDRQRGRPLDYPVGGLADPPKAMIEHNGSVVIAGDGGTALVPLGTGGDAATSRGMERPRGGAASAAAVGDLFTVVAAGRDGWIGVLDRRPGPLGLLPGGASSAASFATDGSLLLTSVSGRLSYGLRQVRPQPLAYKQNPALSEYPTLVTFDSAGQFINDAASSPTYVASAGQFKGAAKIVVWRKDGTLLRDLEPPGADQGTTSSAHRVAVGVGFVPGEDLLVARHVDGPLYLWSTRTWKPLGAISLGASEGLGFTLHESRPLALALERAGADDARLVLVDLHTRATKAVAAPRVLRFAWSRDGSRVALLGLDNTVRFLDADLRETGRPLHLTGAVTTPSSIALSPDAGRVAVGYADRVTVRDTATGDLALPELRVSGTDEIIHLRWSPNGEVLAGITRSPRGREGDRPSGPVELWRVGAIDWGEVLCHWTGSGLTREEWLDHVGPTEPYVDLCAEKK
ncbi:WD40 repeat domain-containing protein [Streptomyces sp. NBC_00572]|uniref:WD40 repeat domain-containing protein n=1 Tax=Streptomyces sp. NBC_00572 TaxID=2903664 RepID=UPI00225B0448|nr:WD40 repeat domain-containing protein [Streptomyces sp. NBC_00572]MCX4985932.1 WD40 repeat domain-containing protein [Streptomyces sp. NBC_00572]